MKKSWHGWRRDDKKYPKRFKKVKGDGEWESRDSLHIYSTYMYIYIYMSEMMIMRGALTIHNIKMKERKESHGKEGKEEV